MIAPREVSKLVASVSCPRCGRNSGRIEVEALRGVSVCYRNDCQQHWWVMWLDAGDVLTQLVPVFGEDLARVNMLTWRLPDRLERGAYWQLSLSRRMYEENGARGSAWLLRAMVDLFHSRNALVGHRQAS